MGWDVSICYTLPNTESYFHLDTPTYVVYHELILTSKEYMTQVTAIDAYWLGKADFVSEEYAHHSLLRS